MVRVTANTCACRRPSVNFRIYALDFYFSCLRLSRRMARTVAGKCATQLSMRSGIHNPPYSFCCVVTLESLLRWIASEDLSPQAKILAVNLHHDACVLLAIKVSMG
jgi:hypothetical protein